MRNNHGRLRYLPGLFLSSIAICLIHCSCSLLKPENSSTPGSVAWQCNILDHSYAQASPGICPNGDIIIGTSDTLVCLRPNGKKRWEYSFDSGFQYGNAVAIAEDGTIYAAVQDSVLFALNGDGTLKWTLSTGSEPCAGPGIGDSGTIYLIFRDGTLRAIQPEGTEEWRYQVEPCHWASSPVLDPEETIYFGLSDGSIHAVTAAGMVKWIRYPDCEWYREASIVDDMLLISGGDRTLYAYDLEGTRLWTFNNGTNTRGVTTGTSVGFSGDLYVGTRDSYVVALRRNGMVQWKTQLPDPEFLEDILTTPLVGDDGSIYACTSGGWIFVLDPNGTLQWQYRVGIGSPGALAMGRNGLLITSDLGGLISALYTESTALAGTLWPKERCTYRNAGQR